MSKIGQNVESTKQYGSSSTSNITYYESLLIQCGSDKGWEQTVNPKLT